MRQSLAALKLQPKEEKTRIAPIDTGFSFLGLSFGPDLDEGYVSAANLEKTLFIRSQFVFVGLDFDSIIIRKDKKLLGRFPIRQVAEIVVFGNNTISASVARRCVEEKIPLSFCTPSGRYLSTLRPDSQKHFLVAGQHLQRHSELNASEMVATAARIVTAKIHNYLAWFRERWPEESHDIRNQIEALLAGISKASSIDATRGFEGMAARSIFPFVNSLCKDSTFHCRLRRKRERIDPYNSLLDFAYSLLFTRLNVLLRGRGLNPYLGILHSHKDHYESLVCDLQEPFRCRIDRFVIKVLNLNVIKVQDFTVDEKGRHNLNSKAIGTFLEYFEREMLTQLRGDGGNLMQLLRAQVYTISEWVADKDGLRFYMAKE
jgi:CRISPR-associated protein Cas1